MQKTHHSLSRDEMRQARLARDQRFDGRFFIGVITTKIFCRPICPAIQPKEENVRYFALASQAISAGFRPCLRCRPESAPGSFAWQGTAAHLKNALHLIDSGYLQNHSIAELAQQLSFSERYLRYLFQHYLGTSPKQYALHSQLLLAKNLIHQTPCSMTEIAHMAGFVSIRQFNASFKKHFNLTPSSLRKNHSKSPDSELQLTIAVQPPYQWQRLNQFYSARLVDGLEWCGPDYYGRTIHSNDYRGKFTAFFRPHRFDIHLTLSDFRYLREVLTTIKRLLDLQTCGETIDNKLQNLFKEPKRYISGLRIPGVWNQYEAGIRAILGQQVSIKHANRLLVEWLSQQTECNSKTDNDDKNLYFPTPSNVKDSSFQLLKIPSSRIKTLIDFTHCCRESLHVEDETLLNIKGFGAWSLAYTKLRSGHCSNQFLSGDLGVRKAFRHLVDGFTPAQAAPWGSYLTLQLWEQLK